MVVLATILFPDTCSIARRTAGTANALTAPTYTYPSLATGVACRFQDEGTNLRLGRDSVQLIEEHPTLFMGRSQSIEEGDQVSAIVRDAASLAVSVTGTFTVTKIRKHVVGGGVTIADHQMVELERLSSGA